MTFAVVPAAGRSSRMGRPKLLLPLGDRTVIERVVIALREGGVERVVCVVAPGQERLAELAERAGADAVQLADATPDMRATVCAGLNWIDAHFLPAPTTPWLLAPADHPTLDPAVVRLLLAAPAGYPDRSIFLPTFDGRRGHPTLLTWRHADAIRSLPDGEGINAHLRRHLAESLELPVATAAVLDDLDTPGDYERLREAWQAGRADPTG